MLRLQRLAGNRAVQGWLGSARPLARTVRPGVSAPSETLEQFETALASLGGDVRRIGDTMMQLRPRSRFKVGADEFKRRLEWLADQLTWVTHAMVWARRLAVEATAGGPDSPKKLAEAGTQLTAAICGARAVSILLAYDDFRYEVANAYNSARLDEQQLSRFAMDGAVMAHGSLDSVLARLSTRSPALVDAAADELLSYNWGWAFSQMKDATEDAIAAHARVERWLSVVMLAWMAFDLWNLAVAGRSGGGGPPRIGGMGGGGAAVAATVLTSAASAEALRRLAALGIVTAPALVKHLGSSSAGGPQAPPKPIEASTKGGTGGKPDPNVRPAPGLPTPAEDAVIQRYTKGLEKLREKYAIRQSVEADPSGPKALQRARAAYETAQRELTAIETEAAGPAGGELPVHLRPLINARHVIETEGLNATTAGTRVACEAVRNAPKNLRGMDFADIEKAIGRPPEVDPPAAKPAGGGKPTGHQRVWWRFSDNSRLVIDVPRELGGRATSADLPHAELHGPKGERLDQQGIEVPDASTSAHMTITDHTGALENHFAPARKGR